MPFDSAVVSSPATIANFGPGFDAFGLCLAAPNDIVSIRRMRNGVREVKSRGGYDIPLDPERNIASYAAVKLSELCGCYDVGFSMTVKKGIKPGSGLGSSAASAVGGALSMAALLGTRNKELVLEASAMGEELVSGSRHFDNVAAAVYGGFTIVSDSSSRTIIKVNPPRFQIVVVLPEMSVETKKAREILPLKVSVADAVCNVGWASGMLHAMMTRNVKTIGKYMDDKVALPYRKELIPGYESVHKAALDAGAIGVSIGGSGPAMFAVTQGNAARIRKAMVNTFVRESGIKAKSFITVPGRGAKVDKIS